MSLNLRVAVPAQGTTKVMRFAEQMSIHEACKTIQEKVGVGGKDHGIFMPNPETDPYMGKWLKPEKSLEFYDLKQNDTIVYKKKSETFKVRLVDDTVKTILADLSVPVSELIEVVGKKVGLKNPLEFSLQEEGKANWLKNTVSLPEQVKSTEQIFVLKKKFFVNDANVSTDDPVELHLVYCQSRDDIISGNHPCTKDEAINFAALQAQISNGNLNPAIHSPGFLSLKEYFPPDFRNKDNEKRVLDEWKKLVGMNEVNARFRYVQLCRSLKTYGMTCFKVREKVKDKKKLMDAVLCFTRDSIVRMEYETKRVIKEHPFKHLLRWAASPETFTMDFGAYEEEYIVVVTNEGEQISNLIGGYIDLLLKKQKDTGVVIEDDNDEIADVQSVARVTGFAATSVQSNTPPGRQTFSTGVTDVYGAIGAMEKIKGEMFSGEMSAPENSFLTPEQRRAQAAEHAKALANLTEGLETMAKGGNKNAMNAAALKMVQLSEQLVISARQAAAATNDPADLMLVDTAKGICDALKTLLAAAQDYSSKPNDPAAREALLRAQQLTAAALQKLGAVAKGAVIDDDAFKLLFKEMARTVNAEAEEMLGKARTAAQAIPDPVKKEQLGTSAQNLADTASQMATIVDILAPTAKDSTCRITLEKAGKAVESASNFVIATAKSSGADPKSQQALLESQKRLGQALANLLQVTELPDMKAAESSDEFSKSAQEILQSTAALMASEGNPELIKQQALIMKNAVAKLGNAGKQIIVTIPDPMHRERLANYLKGVVEGAKKVLVTAQTAAQDPNNKAEHKKLREATTEVSDATQALLSDAGHAVALAALFNSSKLAAAQSTHLITSSRAALNGKVSDPAAQKQLNDSVSATSAALDKLLQTLRAAVVAEAHDAKTARRSQVLRKTSQMNLVQTAKLSNQSDILKAVDEFAPEALKLVSGAKSASARVPDQGIKQDLVYTSNKTNDAVQKMLDHRKALKALKTQLETADAMEAFKATASELEAALISVDTGLLKPTKSKDEALKAFATAIDKINELSDKVMSVAKNSPEDMGAVAKEVATAYQNLVTAASALAASIDDKAMQKVILNQAKVATQQIKQLMQIARAVAANPDDPNLNKLLADAGKNLAEALAKLRQASTGVKPTQIENFQSQASQEIEDLAEKELQGAADAIEKCVAKIQAATVAARERMTAKQVEIEEQNITEAILESCQAIAKSTAVLVSAATAVQQDYNRLVKEPQNKISYKRDPQWAQGLISAARTVAGSVQHLVKAANAAAQGNASEEALIVAAQSVSAATTQLVTASAVKMGNLAQNHQGKLNDAAKKVTAATQALVKAAKDAASWEEETQRQRDESVYNLTDAKIKEMEQQMAILRLEKELEKARGHLATMRKADYANNVNPEFNSGVAATQAIQSQTTQAPARPAPSTPSRPLPAPTKPTPAPAQPTASSPSSNPTVPPPRPGRPTLGTGTGVQWRQNNFTPKK